MPMCVFLGGNTETTKVVSFMSERSYEKYWLPLAKMGNVPFFTDYDNVIDVFFNHDEFPLITKGFTVFRELLQSKKITFGDEEVDLNYIAICDEILQALDEERGKDNVKLLIA